MRQIRGFRCVTHGCEIAHELTDNAALDNQSIRMMHVAVAQHERDSGGICRIIAIDGSAPAAHNYPGKAFS